MTAPESRWRELLDLALPALDHVFGTRVDETARPAWTLGGGTAIAIRLDHRISHDVDLFVPRAAEALHAGPKPSRASHLPGFPVAGP